MILSFKNQFIEKIKAGTKNQTIRDDKAGRWHVGRKIEFWKGNPRNTKQYPYQFGAGVCKEVYPIYIDFGDNYIRIDNATTPITDMDELNAFAVKDGFVGYFDMRAFFISEYKKDVFFGKLIIFDINTTIEVSDNQNTVMCYGERYVSNVVEDIEDESIISCCDSCNLKNKNACRFVPCESHLRDDNRAFVIFIKSKEQPCTPTN